MIDFSGSHFPKDVILVTVRWYLSYALSYKEVEELMQERNVNVDHATVQRWVVKYSPQLLAEFAKKKIKLVAAGEPMKLM